MTLVKYQQRKVCYFHSLGLQGVHQDLRREDNHILFLADLIKRFVLGVGP